MSVQFTVKSLAEELVNDFGIDAGSLRAEEVQLALEEGKSSKWPEVGFASNEVLAGYSSMELSGIEQAKAIAAVVLYITAIDNGCGDIEFCFWKVISVLYKIQCSVDVEFGVELMGQIMDRA